MDTNGSYRRLSTGGEGRTEEENDIECREGIHSLLRGPGVLYKQVFWPGSCVLKLVQQLMVCVQVSLGNWKDLGGSIPKQ